MSCLSNRLTKSFDLFQDRFRRGGPDKGPAAGVVLLDELLDPGNKLLDTFERSPANGLLGNEVEPDLHLIEHRRRSRESAHDTVHVAPCLTSCLPAVLQPAALIGRTSLSTP